ncbi:MAG: hypothetical protein ACOYM5_14380, partial [Caulobacter sp.]
RTDLSQAAKLSEQPAPPHMAVLTRSLERCAPEVVDQGGVGAYFGFAPPLDVVAPTPVEAAWPCLA